MAMGIGAAEAAAKMEEDRRRYEMEMMRARQANMINQSPLGGLGPAVYPTQSSPTKASIDVGDTKFSRTDVYPMNILTIEYHKETVMKINVGYDKKVTVELYNEFTFDEAAMKLLEIIPSMGTKFIKDLCDEEIAGRVITKLES